MSNPALPHEAWIVGEETPEASSALAVFLDVCMCSVIDTAALWHDNAQNPENGSRAKSQKVDMRAGDTQFGRGADYGRCFVRRHGAIRF